MRGSLFRGLFSLLPAACVFVCSIGNREAWAETEVSYGVRLAPVFAFYDLPVLPIVSGENQLSASRFPAQTALEVFSGRWSLLARYTLQYELFSGSRLLALGITSALKPKRLRLTNRPVALWLSQDEKAVLSDEVDRLVVSWEGESLSVSFGRQPLSFGHALLIPIADVFFPLGSTASASEAKTAVDALTMRLRVNLLGDSHFQWGVLPSVATFSGDSSEEESEFKPLGFVSATAYWGEFDAFLLFAQEKARSLAAAGVGAGLGSVTLFGDAVLMLMSDVEVFREDGTGNFFKEQLVGMRGVGGATASLLEDTSLQAEVAFANSDVVDFVSAAEDRSWIPENEFQRRDPLIVSLSVETSFQMNKTLQFSMAWSPESTIDSSRDSYGSTTSPSVLQDWVDLQSSLTWDLDDRSLWQIIYSQSRSDSLKERKAQVFVTTLVTEF